MSVSIDNKRIARNTVFLYLRLIVVLLISLYTTRLVLKALGIVDYGIYEVVGGIVTLFSVLNVTLSNGVNRYINVEKGKDHNGRLNEVFTNSVITQVILALVILVLVETVGLWYLNNKLVIPEDRLPAANWVLQLSMISFVAMVLQAPFSAIIQAHEKMDFYAIVSIICALLKLGGVYILVISEGDTLVLYGVILAVVSVINFLLYFIYCKLKFINIKFNKSINKSLLKEMAGFAGWNALDPLAYTIRGQGTNMVLNFFFGPVLNAAYGISNQVAVAFDQFATQLGLAFTPQLMQSQAAGKDDRSFSLMYAMSKFSFSLQLMLYIPLMVNLSLVLNIWLGEANIPEYTIQFTAFILTVKTINTLNSPISTLILAIGNIKKYMIVTSLIVSSILPLSILFLCLGASPLSVYIIMLALTVLNQSACVVMLSKLSPNFRVKSYLREVIRPLVLLTTISMVPIVGLSLTIYNPVLRFFVTSFISLLLTLSLIYYIILNKTQREMALGVLKNKVRHFTKRSKEL